MVSNLAMAKVIYTDLAPDSVMNFSLPGSSTYVSGTGIQLDIDGKGKTEFHFSYEIFSNISGIVWKVQMVPKDTANQTIWTSSKPFGGNHFIRAIKYGDSIGPYSGFGQDSAPLLGHDQNVNLAGTGDQYIGIRFISGGKIHYGWILLNLKYSGSAGTLTVKSYAYQDISKRKILAGVICKDSYASFKEEACYKYVWNGKLYTQSGTYYDTIANSTGCDSIMTLDLSINATKSVFNETACLSFAWQGKVYTKTGIYLDTLKNSKGCDSVMTLNLQILGSDTVISVLSCNAIVWNGQTLKSTGTYFDTLSNKNDCDSTITLYLTIGANDTVIYKNACYEFEWNGKILDSTGTYVDTLLNRYSCDSVVELHLSLLSTKAFFTESVCNELKWLDKTYTQSGTYIDTIPNSAGCDSIITLELKINSTNAQFEVSACNEYIWLSNIYKESGTYYDTIDNSAGCDSIMTLQLSITTIDTSVTDSTVRLIANSDNAKYQWIDCSDMSAIDGDTNKVFEVFKTGSFAVIVSKNGCTDTSSCHQVIVNGIYLPGQGSMFTLFPVPSSDIISLKGDLSKDLTLTVYSNEGKKLDLPPLYRMNDKINIDVSGLAAGLYFLEGHAGSELISFKFEVVR